VQSSGQNVTINKPTPNILQTGCRSCCLTVKYRNMESDEKPYVTTLTVKCELIFNVLLSERRCSLLSTTWKMLL